MDQEGKIVIAFLFKRSGKNKLKEEEIYLPLSIDLGWFSSKDARKFIEYALSQNLLKKSEDMLSPTFDVNTIAVPVGFFPSKSGYVLSKKDVEEEVFDKIVNQIVLKTNKNSQEIIKDIGQIQSEKNVFPEVAALLLAIEYDLKIADLTTLVEHNIFKENEL